MLSILIRTIIIYVLLSLTLRLMGKRQIGELEIAELVSTLLLSEIAAIPIDNPDIPLLFALIPVMLIVCSEIILSYLKNKWCFLKRLLEGTPSVLVKRGKLQQAELGRMRLSVEELLGELRLQGVTSLDDVNYAILEPNGKLSVILKKAQQQPTCEDLGLSFPDPGITHTVVIDGKTSEEELRASGRDRNWLLHVTEAQGYCPEALFLLAVDDEGALVMIPKAKKGKRK